jgi:hypothetical protein
VFIESILPCWPLFSYFRYCLYVREWQPNRWCWLYSADTSQDKRMYLRISMTFGLCAIINRWYKCPDSPKEWFCFQRVFGFIIVLYANKLYSLVADGDQASIATEIVSNLFLPAYTHKLYPKEFYLTLFELFTRSPNKCKDCWSMYRW